jgi:hypothetical protein
MQAVILLPRRMTFGSAAAALVPSARFSYTPTSAKLRTASRAVHPPPLITPATHANRPPTLAAVEQP